MKLKYNIMALCMVSGLWSLTGCNDDEDNWTPGEQVKTEYQVYFTCENPVPEELAPNVPETYTLSFSRENADKALSLPLVTSGAVEFFEAPATVDFAEGETDTEITVNFKGAENIGFYNYRISVPEGNYNSPYTSYCTTIDIQQRVANWHLYASNVKVTDCYAELFSDAYYVDLYQDGDLDRYRINGFMDNYNLTFTLSEKEGEKKTEVPGLSGYYYIYPEGGSYGVDDYGNNAWFFDTEKGDVSFPLYHEQLSGYLDWGYLFVPDSYTSISFKYRYAYIYASFMGFGAGMPEYPYVYFELTWKKRDEVANETEGQN